MMALRASATGKLHHHPPPPSSSVSKPLSPTKLTHGLHLRHNSSLSLSTSTPLSLITLFTTPIEANALPVSKDDIASSIVQIEEKIDQVQKVGYNVFESTENAIHVVVNFLRPAGDVAVKITTPVISEVLKKAEEVIQSLGLDTQPVYSAAKTVQDVAQQTGKVIEEAKPIVSTTVQTISSANATTVIATGGVLFLVYFLLPPVFSAISFKLRGYKGDLTPAQVLDLVSLENYTLIDIRSEKDKEKYGIPRLPSNAKNKMIAIPLEELPSKLKGIVRDTKKVEAELTAVKISFLKRINKSSNIVIMDTYTDSAKIVASYLTMLGFKNCWVMAGGFSGSRGWSGSQLGTDSYNVSSSRILSPTRVIPAGQSFGTASSRKLLSD